MRKLSMSLKRYYLNASTIAKASLWFVLVTVIDNAISVLTQPFINRILSVEEVGVYGSYMSWHSIFAVIATLNLYCGILEVLLTKEAENKKQIVKSLATLSLAISFIFFGICILFIKPISTLLKLKPEYFIVMGISIIAEAVIQFWCVPKRYEYSYKEYSYLMVGLFFFKSVLSVALAYFMYKDRAFGRMLGMTIPSVAAAIVLGKTVFGRSETQGITEYWKQALKFNIPLLPHYLSSILLASSDRVMIQRLCGDKEAGLYTVAYSFAGLTLIVFQALNSAYSPYALQAIQEERYEGLRKETNILITCSVTFSILLILFVPEGLFLLGGTNYIETAKLIPILISGIFFSSFYLVFSNVEFVFEKTRYVFPITLLGATVNILLNFIFIPLWGYEVAAYTTLIGYIIIAVAHYIASKKISNKPYFDIKMIMLEMICLLVTSIACIYLYDLPNIIRYIIIAGVVIVGAVFGMKNKKSLYRYVSKKNSTAN